MQELITRNYWWPGLMKFVADYVKGCDDCNRTKTFPAPPLGKLQPNPISQEPWKHIFADFITKLPESRGLDSIMVVCYRHTKRTHFIPCSEELSSVGLAQLYLENVWKLHRLPDSIISDRGPQFASCLTKELNQLLGIQTSLSTAYLLK